MKTLLITLALILGSLTAQASNGTPEIKVINKIKVEATIAKKTSDIRRYLNWKRKVTNLELITKRNKTVIT